MKLSANGKRRLTSAASAAVCRALAERCEPRRLMSGLGFTISDVAEFSSSGGYESLAGLVRDASGNVYGVTRLGGANNDGTVFKVASGGSTITTLASFNSSTGCNPIADLIMDGSGNLFGTTPDGGANSQGTVFEVHSGSGTVTPLASFTSSANDIGAVKLVLDSRGDLFGVTPLGGANNVGSIFEITAGSGAIATLASFSNATGDEPSSGVVMDSAGDLFGTTPRNGADGFGSIYELPFNHSSVSVLAPFTSSNAPEQASGLVLDSNGNLYGTTQFGGANSDGSVYELTHSSQTITTLASFNSSNGANPSSSPLLDSSGDLFGATAAGGAGSDGTAYEVVAGTGSITTLASFSTASGYPGTDGFSQNAVMPDLIGDTHGNFFGVAPGGTNGSLGAVYELSPAVDSQVVITQQPANVTAGAPQSISASIETASGIVDSTSHVTVTLSVLSGPGGTLGGTLTTQASSGVATFTGIYFTTAGVYEVRAASTGLGAGVSNSITVVAGAASKLVVTQQPTTTPAGQSISNIVASVEDNYGNVITADGSLVTITGPAGTTVNGTTAVNAVSGVATFTGLSINTAGNYSLQFSDGSFTSANTSSFAITGAAATQLVITQEPAASIAAGQTIGPVIADVEDAFGNIVTAGSSSVSISDGGIAPLNGSTSVTTINGIATFSSLSIKLVGTYAMSLSDGSLTPASTGSFNITAAAASKLVVTQQPPASTPAGTPMLPIAVAIEDQYGNVVSVSTAAVTAATHGGTAVVGTPAVAASSGVATFNNLAVDKTGAYTLAITSTGLTSTNTSSFAITAAVASQLIIAPATATTVAGQPIGPMHVSVEDAFGDVITSDSSMVTITADGPTLAGTTSAAAMNGVAQFSNLSMTTAGVYIFTASDGSLTPATSGAITINAGPATQLFITQSPTTGTADQAISPVVVEAQDAFGNLAIGDQSSVTMTAQIAGGGSATSVFTGTKTILLQAGAATFTDLTFSQAGTYTLTAADAAIPVVTSPSITVSASISPTPDPTPGPTPSPSNYVTIAGVRLKTIVLPTATAFAGTSGAAGHAFTMQLVNDTTGGVLLVNPTFAKHGDLRISNLKMYQAGPYTLVITDARGDKIDLQITVLPASPKKLEFVTEPKTLDVASLVTVQVVDGYGNLATTDDDATVTLGVIWPRGAGKPPTLEGTTTADFVNAVATFPDLSISRPGRARLIAKASKLPAAESDVFVAG